MRKYSILSNRKGSLLDRAARLHRVRVGRYPRVQDATQAAQALEKTLGWQVSVVPLATHVVARATASDSAR
jgi:hypothetical protein